MNIEVFRIVKSRSSPRAACQLTRALPAKRVLIRIMVIYGTYCTKTFEFVGICIYRDVEFVSIVFVFLTIQITVRVTIRSTVL